MANYTLIAPVLDIPASPVSFGSREAIKNLMLKGWNKYWKAFKTASEATNIPVKILVAFATIESGISATAGAGATKSMLQTNWQYINEQLKNEFLSGRLSELEKSELAKYGFKFDSKGNTRQYTAQDNLNAPLNILVGAIVLGQLIDQPFGHNDDGTLNLSNIVTVYNTGLFSPSTKKIKANKPQTAKATYDLLAGNTVTQSYLRKALGANSVLDILTKELNNTVV